jgi:hypothetical protein
MQGAEANFVYRLSETRFGQMKLLAGFRYLNLREELSITDTTNVSNGSHSLDTDQFSTRDQFYGGQIGARSFFGGHRLSLELDGRVAIGSNRQSIEINGATSISNTSPPNIRGGILAVISNIGQYQRNEFTVVPEAKVQLAYKFKSHLRAFIGYDFLYWNKVVRPGEQIDRVVNPALIRQFGVPTNTRPIRPIFTFNDTGFWAQGIGIGVQTRF